MQGQVATTLGCWALALAALTGCSNNKAKPAQKGAQAQAQAQAKAKQASPAAKDPRFVLGEQVFKTKAQPACSTCHILEAAGAVGTVGPNLDALQKTEADIVRAVTGGLGLMPAQADKLSKEEIEAVAYYVVKARKVH